MKLTVIAPAYNEEENLPILIPEIVNALRGSGHDLEILVVNDGSTDGTADVLRSLCEEHECLRVIEFVNNAGQTAAWDAAFKAATGDVVVTIDADLQSDPKDILMLLSHIDGYDVVSGIRQNRQDTWVRLLSSRIANSVRNKLTGDHVTDVGCSLRAIRREFVEGLQLYDHMHRFLPTLLKLRGARCTEVPVRHRPRLHGQPKYGVFDRLFCGIVDLFAVRWMIKRWLRYEIRVQEEPEQADRPVSVAQSTPRYGDRN